MKVIAIGDIHGRYTWQNIVRKNMDADKIVFIGDYVDPYPHEKGAEQITSRLILNFQNILDLKKDYPDKIVLLIGNHDYHYLPGIEAAYSRFDGSIARDMEEILTGALEEELLQVCFAADGVLYSHAGFTKTWCENCYVDLDNIEEFCNNLFLHNTWDFGFKIGEYGCDPTGDDEFQSPMWVRPPSLRSDVIDGWKQVVGHAQGPNVQIVTMGGPGSQIAFIDCLGHCKEYVEVVDGEINRRKV